jgi:hypothetical protein
MAAARLAERLLRHGFAPADRRTDDLVRRWAGADLALLRWGNSADHLRRTGQQEDLEFIVQHVDDLGFACSYRDGEVRAAREPEPARRPAPARAVLAPPPRLPAREAPSRGAPSVPVLAEG